MCTKVESKSLAIYDLKSIHIQIIIAGGQIPDHKQGILVSVNDIGSQPNARQRAVEVDAVSIVLEHFRQLFEVEHPVFRTPAKNKNNKQTNKQKHSI